MNTHKQLPLVHFRFASHAFGQISRFYGIVIYMVYNEHVVCSSRYNRTVRYDWLSRYLFDSIEEVQEYATRWLWTYNHERPNMGLGGITPIQKLAMVA